MSDCYVSRANPVSYHDENRSFSDTSCYLSLRVPFTPTFSSQLISLNKRPLFKHDSVFGLIPGHNSISSFKNYRLDFAMDGLQGSGTANKELEEFLQQEQQKLQFQTQATRLTEICWDKCMGDKMGSKLDGKTETCVSNCVERFIDTSVAVAQRFQSLLQKQMDQSV